MVELTRVWFDNWSVRRPGKVAEPKLPARRVLLLQEAVALIRISVLLPLCFTNRKPLYMWMQDLCFATSLSLL
jgi:hypothetical protein